MYIFLDFFFSFFVFDKYIIFFFCYHIFFVKQ